MISTSEDKNSQEANYDEKKDSIANSDINDMFAFSEIIAGGNKVSQVTAEMEKEQSSGVQPGQQDENDAILAFSDTLPGNENEPVAVQNDEIAKQKEAEAQKELTNFENNESTAAFAGLAMAQEIQKKVDVQNDTLNPEENKDSRSAEQIEKDFNKLSSTKKKTKDSGPPPDSEAIQLESSVQVSKSSGKKQKKGKPIITAQVKSSGKSNSAQGQTNMMSQLQKLHFTPEQIQYLSQMTQPNATPQQPEPQQQAVATNEVVAAQPIQSQIENKVNQFQKTENTPTQEEDTVASMQQAQAQVEELIQQKEEIESQNDKKKEPLPKGKKGKPVDELEKNEQPADNDDDEKISNNHEKMSKIQLKRDEIVKLQDTHQALTKDALKQAKSGASMIKVKHNLKIAKNVAKRVEDLKQQVATDKSQLEQVDDGAEDKIVPTTVEDHHKDVGNIPSVQDSSTGARHDQQSSSLVGVDQKNMGKKGKKHSKKYYTEVSQAKQQIKLAESGMKQMDSEVKDFHNRMANSMQLLMKSFQDGFAALENAKKDEKNLTEEQQTPKKEEAQTTTTDESQAKQTKKEISLSSLSQKKKSQKAGQTVLAQQESTAEEGSGNQNALIQQLKSQLDTLLQNQKKQKASSKVSADEFDNTNGANEQKRTSEDVSEGDDAQGEGKPPTDKTSVQLKQNARHESEMLSQGKMLADQFDSDSKFTDESNKKVESAKSTKKNKGKPKSEKKQKKEADKKEPKKKAEPVKPNDETQKLADELQADPGVTTEQLEAQAAALVQQANAAMGQPNQDLGQPTQPTAPAAPAALPPVIQPAAPAPADMVQTDQQAVVQDTQKSKQHIAELLGKLSSLTQAAKEKTGDVGSAPSTPPPDLSNDPAAQAAQAMQLLQQANQVMDSKMAGASM